ncbi:hypothetical protein SAICODRAFT_30713 [Saitoella complicata NRRL Y-17804]|uniref:uncharacterized protein n=1 Tax=Saitoella complicata (strain BCRC 22490 / CBS 7301 / JCM 7358 / NBRC 10748 / NRRL Y-17804) TaxID=698492 RepID=UPI00086714F3|nr:uncharacterized protein SAICODRAFT_30713 [Saitoella complicata NRRL Y-17804]ODQ52613.1 hypothetical protein SAICODRAFT_30713 [Saitoella complicata NRRL Y-17804]
MNSTHAREVAQAEDAHCQSGHPDLTPSSRVEIDGNLVTLRFVANFQSGEGCGREHMSSCLRLQWQCPGSELTPEACQSITAKLEEASVKLTQEAGHRVISSRSTYSPGTDQNAMLAKKDARTVFLQYESAHEAMLALQNFTRQYVQCSFPVSYPKMSNIYVRVHSCECPNSALSGKAGTYQLLTRRPYHLLRLDRRQTRVTNQLRSLTYVLNLSSMLQLLTTSPVHHYQPGLIIFRRRWIR